MNSLFTLSVLISAATVSQPIPDRPNMLIITVDDMSADSLGAYGCSLEGTSRTIDDFAETALRFQLAHVPCGNCMPCRNALWSGRYPHSNGVEGFYQVRNADYPVLCDLMQSAGYFTGIRGKVNHSTPYSPYAWDINLDRAPDGTQRHIKDPTSYGEATEQGITLAQESGQPFCLVINVSDPHKPFYSEMRQDDETPDPYVPTRVFTADEVPIPGFLFDDPIVREELALDHSSVRRADDCVREILHALDASGASESTIVVFLSDHGMPLPFAKTQLYHHSTHTPLMVRWPGVTGAGTIDEQHMIAGVDILPTLLDIAGVSHPDGLQGRSFEPLLHGETQSGRDMVFKEHTENAGRSRDPMRAIQTREYLYIFNAWSNGERVMATATTGTATYRRLRQLAMTDPDLAARNDLYRYRVVEELYDVVNDPDCLHNLTDDADHASAP